MQSMSFVAQKKLLFVIGTRPEAIKMAPLIAECQKNPNIFKVVVCATGQHIKMLYQVLNFFSIKPDFELNLMTDNQDSIDITSSGLQAIKSVVIEVNPDLILVQGDTTSAFIGAMVGFYTKCKVAHIEAGLRSGDKNAPYPEETYRTLISHIANYHFVPTNYAKNNLEKENIRDNIYVVGNTVIDALKLSLQIIKDSGEEFYYKHFDFLDYTKKIILITGHRRENLGPPLEEICRALKDLANKYDDVQFIYPVHLNPNVQTIVNNMLQGIKNFFLVEPLDYPHMVWLMEKSYMIITDSGGIQEEAPYLKKPLVITRDTTERIEGIECGVAKLVGTDYHKIVKTVCLLLEDEDYYNTMAKNISPYGDGNSSRYIATELLNMFTTL